MFLQKLLVYFCVVVLFHQYFAISNGIITPKKIFTVTSEEEKLKISVYYEVLCPDSIRFFTRQLYPTYKLISSSLTLDLIPYGKAIQNQNAEGRWIFDCQHGPDECYGNKVHACILNQTLSEDDKMLLLNCMMSSSSPAHSGSNCATLYKIDYTPISDCANNFAGDNLLAHYGDITHNAAPQITFVPTIEFNDSYDYNYQSMALRNLLQISCNLLNNKPPQCSR